MSYKTNSHNTLLHTVANRLTERNPWHMSSITAYSVSVLAGQTGAVRLQCGNSQIPCYIKDCMLLYSHFTTEEEKE